MIALEYGQAMVVNVQRADGGRANPQLEPAYAQPQIVCVDHLAMLPSLAGCGKLDSVWQMGKMQTSSFSW